MLPIPSPKKWQRAKVSRIGLSVTNSKSQNWLSEIGFHVPKSKSQNWLSENLVSCSQIQVPKLARCSSYLKLGSIMYHAPRSQVSKCLRSRETWNRHFDSDLSIFRFLRGNSENGVSFVFTAQTAHRKKCTTDRRRKALSRLTTPAAAAAAVQTDPLCSPIAVLRIADRRQIRKASIFFLPNSFPALHRHFCKFFSSFFPGWFYAFVLLQVSVVWWNVCNLD